MLLRNVFSANFLVQCQHVLNASYRHLLHYFLLCKYLTEYFWKDNLFVFRNAFQLHSKLFCWIFHQTNRITNFDQKQFSSDVNSLPLNVYLNVKLKHFDEYFLEKRNKTFLFDKLARKINKETFAVKQSIKWMVRLFRIRKLISNFFVLLGAGTCQGGKYAQHSFWN